MFEIDKDFIINLRKKLKLSQLVFASVLSVNLLTIKNWEKGITTTSNKERTRSNNTNYNGMDGLIHE